MSLGSNTDGQTDIQTDRQTEISPFRTGLYFRQNGGQVEKQVLWALTRIFTANMQVSQPNDVKIYNLSAGKSLPEVSFLFTPSDRLCCGERSHLL